MTNTAEPSIEIVEECDSGLYGKVYRARQVALDRIVAVKIIKPDWPGSADAIEHARAIARVGPHPNIVTVHDVAYVPIQGFDQPQPAMIMEWLDGEVLGVRLGGPRFSEQETRRICVGVLDGLERMHASGVAHGDLHFGNVILLADCTPKIIDIDANKDHSLARLSTISREGAVQSDIEYCQRIIYHVFSHGSCSIALRSRIELELQQAKSIPELREVVERALAGWVNGPSAPIPAQTVPFETAPSLAGKVQQFIEDRKPASLRSLVLNQTRLVCDELLSDSFSLREPATSETIRNRVKRYEESIGPVLAGLSVGCFWGSDGEVPLWSECIGSVANLHSNSMEGGTKLWFDLRLYPSLMMLYAGGMGAFLNRRFVTLRGLLRELEYIEHGRRQRLARKVYHWEIDQRAVWNRYVLNNENKYTPISERLEELTYQAMGGLILEKNRFQLEFDRFEYFLGLVECYGDDGGVSPPTGRRGPYGSFIWRCKEHEDSPREWFLREVKAVGTQWSPLLAGFFGGSVEGLHATISAYEAFLDAVRGSLSIW